MHGVKTIKRVSQVKERIVDVRWEGFFTLEQRRKADYLTKKCYVLYALYGTHHLYGQQALLYIGRTEVDLKSRLVSHLPWIKDEFDEMKIKVASVREFSDITDWWNTWDIENPYGPANAELVKDVETLLIYAHQPAYNTQGKNSLNLSKGHVRIFNTGKLGLLLPEVSSTYYAE